MILLITGLIVSGMASFCGYLLALFDLSTYFAGILLGSGAFFGLFFGASSIISFVYGTSLFLISHMDSYWQSFYPINFGFTLLGIALWQYNFNIHMVWIITALIFALAIAYTLYKTKISKSRWLLIALIALLFINGDFWSSFVIGNIFIALACTQEAKRIFQKKY